MNENRRQILEMLAAGKINADEAEKLLAAIETSPDSGPADLAHLLEPIEPHYIPDRYAPPDLLVRAH